MKGLLKTMIGLFIACASITSHADLVGLTNRQGDCTDGFQVARITEAGKGAKDFVGCWKQSTEAQEAVQYPTVVKNERGLFISVYSKSIEFGKEYGPGELINVSVLRDGIYVFYMLTAKQFVHMDGTSMDFANTER